MQGKKGFPVGQGHLAHNAHILCLHKNTRKLPAPANVIHMPVRCNHIERQPAREPLYKGAQVAEPHAHINQQRTLRADEQIAIRHIELVDHINLGRNFPVWIFGFHKVLPSLSIESFFYICGIPAPGPQNEKYPRDITVEDCYFYDLGRFEKQSAAVTLSVASRVTVCGNTIHHLLRAGINLCDGCFGGHLIENNDLFDCVRETGDHGPFNRWGRDRFWSLGEEDTMGRRGKEKKPYALLDAVEPVRIHHNRLAGSRGFGIDLDDGSSNYEITDNLCRGVRQGDVLRAENDVAVTPDRVPSCGKKGAGSSCSVGRSSWN